MKLSVVAIREQCIESSCERGEGAMEEGGIAKERESRIYGNRFLLLCDRAVQCTLEQGKAHSETTSEGEGATEGRLTKASEGER